MMISTFKKFSHHWTYKHCYSFQLTIFGLVLAEFGTIAFLVVLGASVAGWEEAVPAADSLSGTGGIKEDAVKMLKLLQVGCSNEGNHKDNIL